MEQLKFSQEGIIQTPAAPEMIAVSRRDLARLRKTTSNVIERKQIYQNVAFLSFGFSGSAGFAIIGFYNVINLPAWILPTSWAALAVSLIVGVAFLILDSEQKKMATNSLQNVLEEIDALGKDLP